MKKIMKRILLLSLSILAATNTIADTSSNREENVSIYKYCLLLSGVSFKNEIANTPQKMARGLMFRKQMAKNESMLFVFPFTQRVSFWMKNTLIPLDMLFFNEDRVLLETKVGVPPCKTEECPVYTSTEENVRFVLEVLAGTVESLGIHLGETFDACQ